MSSEAFVITVTAAPVQTAQISRSIQATGTVAARDLLPVRKHLMLYNSALFAPGAVQTQIYAIGN